uniref:(northern house mosquito) hypothetical protein n=1 Tax=Culex pipiens TaxID=7175 RepID=A0A8D8IX71_CULPI
MTSKSTAKSMTNSRISCTRISTSAHCSSDDGFHSTSSSIPPSIAILMPMPMNLPRGDLYVAQGAPERHQQQCHQDGFGQRWPSTAEVRLPQRHSCQQHLKQFLAAL